MKFAFALVLTFMMASCFADDAAVVQPACGEGQIDNSGRGNNDETPVGQPSTTTTDTGAAET